MRMILASTFLLIGLSTGLASAESFHCKIDKKIGLKKSIPSELVINIDSNSTDVTVQDELAAFVGKRVHVGEEGGKRSRFRRFTWEIRSAPNVLLPSDVQAAGRKLILYAATIDHGTNKLKLRVTFIKGTASPHSGVHQGKGRCTLRG